MAIFTRAPGVNQRRLAQVASSVAAAFIVAACGLADLATPPPADADREALAVEDLAEPDESSESGNRSGDNQDAPREPGDAANANESDEAAGPVRPNWLGTRPLPLRHDGFGEIQSTPEELTDRRFPPPDDQPLAAGTDFKVTVIPASLQVLERSTWSANCPVTADNLRLMTMTFWGFDGQVYIGEMLVHASAANALSGVFEAIFEAKLPIEEMRIITNEDLAAPPTGDGNITTGFVCRPPVSGSGWSQHAYGLAVDINPFHNPYVRGDLIIPELASAYTDRDDIRPGMMVAGDVATTAFANIGWGWGGDWQSLTDPMHFSATGR
ncbi:MAG: M15 family metallopeptidase [Nitriliruptoraceae bacterium]